MAEKKKRVITTADNAVIIPRDIVKSLSNITENDIKVLVFVCAVREYTIADIAQALDITTEEVEQSLDNLTQAGHIASEEITSPRYSKTPLLQSYDSKTLHDALEEKQSFYYIKNNVEDILGKVLNKNEINLLFNLHNFFGLSADYICCLTIYCTSKGKTNMNYIVKTALSLYDDEIDTYEKLEAYFQNRNRIEDAQTSFIRTCGMSGRNLTPKEKSFLTRWFDEFEMPYELIINAYEKTIDAIGKANLTYMDKIICDWYAMQCKTIEDVNRLASKPKKPATNGKNNFQNDSFDVDEFWETAVKKG